MLNLTSTIKEKIKADLFEKNPQKYYHSLRVAEIALELAEKESVKGEGLIETGALLHDLAPSKIGEENNRNSAKLARHFLRGKLSEGKIKVIEKEILVTDKKLYKNLSPGEAVVHDANILDLIGTIGLLRIAYNMGRENDHDSMEDLPRWFNSYSSKLEKMLYTESAKVIAKKKILETKKLE